MHIRYEAFIKTKLLYLFLLLSMLRDLNFASYTNKYTTLSSMSSGKAIHTVYRVLSYVHHVMLTSENSLFI